MRELLRDKLQQLGFSVDEYSLHSLRVGSAKAAAGVGVPDRVFKRHGRWKSDNTKDGYVEDSLGAVMSRILSVLLVLCSCCKVFPNIGWLP